MKPLKLLTVLLVGFCLSARSGIIYSPYANGGDIPDGGPVGLSATATASGLAPIISGITVNLNISGGYNGDLYAYLSYDGVLVPLLNHVGVGTGNSFGYGNTGFDVTLGSSGANNIHFYQNYSPTYNSSGQLTGTWQPDGRAINPQSAPTAFDAPGTVTFAALNGLNPNGTWTLFIADLSSGGGQSQLVSWSLGITAVPEPVNVALGVFAGVFVVVGLGRAAWVRRGFSKRRRNQPSVGIRTGVFRGYCRSASQRVFLPLL
jgi:subtilisin-like proprotein convertase family protein